LLDAPKISDATFKLNLLLNVLNPLRTRPLPTVLQESGFRLDALLGVFSSWKKIPLAA